MSKILLVFLCVFTVSCSKDISAVCDNAGLHDKECLNSVELYHIYKKENVSMTDGQKKEVLKLFKEAKRDYSKGRGVHTESVTYYLKFLNKTALIGDSGSIGFLKISKSKNIKWQKLFDEIVSTE